ncbi:hypothetical protein LINPERHAP2_LOCUS30051 [Linum perenne]
MFSLVLTRLVMIGLLLPLPMVLVACLR